MDSQHQSTSDDGSSSSSSSPSEAPRPTKRPRKQNDQPLPPPLEIAPSVSSNAIGNAADRNARSIIVLLDQARLETVKTRKGNFELLNCDDHRDLCRKYKKNPAEHRPDICHQELLALMDSPLNKAGHLQVYLRTAKGVLIELHPSVRVPRTFKRFSGLMVQLLHKMKIKSAPGSGPTKTLMRVIKNPFSQHLPPGTRAFGMSCRGTLYSPHGLCQTLVPESPGSDGQQPPTCFVIGAMSTGHVTREDHPYIEEMISVSEYPLSGAAAISRIMGGIEHHWGIV